MRKYAANFVPVTCIGSLAHTMPKGRVYGLYVIKGLVRLERQEEAPASNPFVQSGKRKTYIKSIKSTAGECYRVRLTNGSVDFTCMLYPQTGAILAIPNHMLDLTQQDFADQTPPTYAVPKHHIDEAVAAKGSRWVYWLFFVIFVYWMFTEV